MKLKLLLAMILLGLLSVGPILVYADDRGDCTINAS